MKLITIQDKFLQKFATQYIFLLPFSFSTQLKLKLIIRFDYVLTTSVNYETRYKLSKRPNNFSSTLLQPHFHSILYPFDRSIDWIFTAGNFSLLIRLVDSLYVSVALKNFFCPVVCKRGSKRKRESLFHDGWSTVSAESLHPCSIPFSGKEVAEWLSHCLPTCILIVRRRVALNLLNYLENQRNGWTCCRCCSRLILTEL